MAALCLVLSLLVVCLESSHSLKMHNPYRHALELLKQEPLMGDYAKVNDALAEELWITQKVDHFDEQNNATWQMRYMENSNYFQPHGPIYIFVGGEWTISKSFLCAGLMHDMAKENGGMLYYTEHRYYGKSWPMSNATTENLRYLSVRQALADLAHFIRTQQTSDPNKSRSKVVLVGGSYSGSMVAWMSRLYPKLVTVGWASSAPMTAKADFYEYMEEVTEAIRRTSGSVCAQRIEAGLQNLTDVLNSQDAQTVMNRLNACKNFDTRNKFDRAAFFNGIANYFANIVQTYSSLISMLCNALMTSHAEAGEAMMTFLTQLFTPLPTELGAGDETFCQDFSYDGMLKSFTDVVERETGTRSWFYQTCNEFGWYIITKQEPSKSFGSQVPLSYFRRLCVDAFGTRYSLANMSLGICKTNELSSGNGNCNRAYNNKRSKLRSNTQDTHPAHVTYDNVFFSYGMLDPWRAVGMKSGLNVLVVPGYSHVADLGSIDVDDGTAMCLAKLRITSFVRKRLQHKM